MPIYEFKCNSCGQISEFIVPSFNTAENLQCPDCGSHYLERLLSTPSLVRERSHHSGSTCCGRKERCEKPPCAPNGRCSRD